MEKIIKEIKKVLVNNGYEEVEDNKFFSDEFGKIRVTLIPVNVMVTLTVSVTKTDGLFTSDLTHSVVFRPEQEEEYDMYDEYGTPEEIVEMVLSKALEW